MQSRVLELIKFEFKLGTMGQLLWHCDTKCLGKTRGVMLRVDTGTGQVLRLPIHKTNRGFFRFPHAPSLRTKGKLLATSEHGFGNQFGALLLQEASLGVMSSNDGTALPTGLSKLSGQPELSARPPVSTELARRRVLRRPKLRPPLVREVRFCDAEATALLPLRSTPILY